MSVYPLNKKFIVCEGLKVRLNLVSSFSFWFIFPPTRVDLSVCPSVQQAMMQFVSGS